MGKEGSGGVGGGVGAGDEGDENENEAVGDEEGGCVPCGKVRDLVEWVGVGVVVGAGLVVVVAWGILLGAGERRGGKQGRAEN